MCSIAALPRLRAPRPHIARRRIDQPGIGLEAIIGAEHRLVPMPQAHPFGGQDDHARPGVQQRPGFRQRRAELLELGAQLVDRRTARLLDAQRQDRAQRGAVHVPAMAPGGSARSRTAVSTATGHTPRPGRPARADRLAAHAGMPIARRPTGAARSAACAVRWHRPTPDQRLPRERRPARASWPRPGAGRPGKNRSRPPAGIQRSRHGLQRRQAVFPAHQFPLDRAVHAGRPMTTPGGSSAYRSDP